MYNSKLDSYELKLGDLYVCIASLQYVRRCHVITTFHQINMKIWN